MVDKTGKFFLVKNKKPVQTSPVVLFSWRERNKTINIWCRAATLVDVGGIWIKSVGNHVLSRSGAEVRRINDADIQLRIN